MIDRPSTPADLIDEWIVQLNGRDLRAIVSTARLHGRSVQVILKADAQGRVTARPKVISD